MAQYQQALHRSTRGDREEARRLFYDAAAQKKPNGAYVMPNHAYIHESLKAGVTDEGEKWLLDEKNPLNRPVVIVDLFNGIRAPKTEYRAQLNDKLKHSPVAEKQ